MYFGTHIGSGKGRCRGTCEIAHRRYTPCRYTALSDDVGAGNGCEEIVDFASRRESRVSLSIAKTWKKETWMKTLKKAGWNDSIRGARRLARRGWEVVVERADGNMSVGCALDMGGKEKVEE